VIAEKYGYWISPNPAAETANTPTAIEAVHGAAAKAHQDTRRAHVVFLGLFIGLVASLTIGGITRHALGFILGALIGMIFIAAAMLVIANRKGRRHVSRNSQYLMQILQHHSWQAWPCVAEGQDGNPNSFAKHIYLMSPQQEVVRVFTAVMPQDVWWSLTDGMGVLWVGGDLRYAVIMGSQLGEQIWIAHPYQKPVAAPMTTMTTQVFQDLARSATSSAVQRLIGG